jgi:hypothetical protein
LSVRSEVALRRLEAVDRLVDPGFGFEAREPPDLEPPDLVAMDVLLVAGCES